MRSEKNKFKKDSGGESSIFVIGINDDGVEGLSERAKRKIAEAETLVGGKRHIKLVEKIARTDDIIFIKADIKKVLDEIETRLRVGRRVVVLNSGDPLFYGFGKNLIARFGKEMCEFIPAVSAFQLAFARVKEPWENAKLLSIHSKKFDISDFLHDIRENEKIVFFTSGRDDPKKIARFLMEHGLRVRKFFVLENLGGETERVLDIKPEEAESYEFSSLNTVLILKEKEPRSFLFGLPESEFSFRGEKSGLITKGEVRAVVLSKLGLTESSCVWDIGAGSGSVAVESALFARRGKVFAIEKNPEFTRLIRKNAERFGVRVEIICGEAPDVLRELPDPDSVFIGGGGKKIREILEECLSRKSVKNIVATFVVPQHLSAALSFLKKKAEVDVSFINITKLKSVDDYDIFTPFTSVFVMHAKPI